MQNKTIAIALSILASAAMFSGSAFADQPADKSCPVVKGAKVLGNAALKGLRKTKQAVFYVGHSAVNLTTGTASTLGGAALDVTNTAVETVSGTYRIFAPKSLELPADALDSVGDGVNTIGGTVLDTTTNIMDKGGNGILDATEKTIDIFLGK
jgi:hypothetical protein